MPSYPPESLTAFEANARLGERLRCVQICEELRDEPDDIFPGRLRWNGVALDEAIRRIKDDKR